MKKCRFLHSSSGRISSFHSPFTPPPLSLPAPPPPPSPRRPLLPPGKCWSLMIQPNNRRHVPGSRVASRDPRPPPPFLPSRPLAPLPSSCFSSLSSPDQGHLLCYNLSSLFLFLFPLSHRLSFLSPLLFFSSRFSFDFFSLHCIFFFLIFLFGYVHPTIFFAACPSVPNLFLFFNFLSSSSLFQAPLPPSPLPLSSLGLRVEQTDAVFTSGAAVYGDVLPLLAKAK